MNVTGSGKSYFSVAEVAARLGVSRNTVTRRFEDYPGVIDHGQPDSPEKRRYRVLRIPESAIREYILAHRVREMSVSPRT